VRTVDVGRIVGNTRSAHGANPTSRIRIYTDRGGNLISTFPVP